MMQVGRDRHRMKDYSRHRRWICRSRQGSSWLINSETLKSITGGICKSSECVCTKELKWKNLEL